MEGFGLPKDVSRIVGRRSTGTTARCLNDAGSTLGPKKTHAAPLIYQSCGAEEPLIPSLSMRKCTISGDRPLKRGKSISTVNRKIAARGQSYVCVSCVFTHVSRRRTPVSQSFLPCSERSWNLGGAETLSTEAVLTAPSIRSPGKKQTRWSCLGASSQVLLTRLVTNNQERGRDAPYTSPPGLFSGTSSEV